MDPFKWHEDGECGLGVSTDSPQVMAHEVLYENDVTSIKDRPFYMGPSIPVKRLKFAYGVVLALTLLLLGRAFWMQVVQGKEFQALAERNRLRREAVPARRGIITDRRGKHLAENMPSFDVHVVPSRLPKETEARELELSRMGRVIGLGVSEIEVALASSTDPDETVTIKRDLDYERALSLRIMAANSPGIEVFVGSKRQYQESRETQSLSHILGYLGGITREELSSRREQGYRQTDAIGKTGVEAAYERILRGTPGERLLEVDARHRVTAVVGEREAIDGEDIRLTLDLDLQKAAEAALKKQMELSRLERGAAVALDPRDGSILAAVSLPAYDGNLFSGTVSSTGYRALVMNPNRPLLPRAWAGVYPSGSTAKPVIAAAALAEKIILPNTTVLSIGGIKIGPWFFPDWKAGGHGVVNVKSAIAWSVNTFFYYVGGGYGNFIGLGVERLTDWMRRFGLGARTGLDLPGEMEGFVPSREWKQRVKKEPWFIGDTYNLSIGQGDLLVTPLQVAAFTAAVANGGYVIQPHVGLSVGSPSSSRMLLDPYRASSTLAAPEVMNVVRAGMRENVTYGSGRALSDLPVTSAGKTGTAQWRSDRQNHAWFTVFAPYENPQVVVTVLLEEGNEGSSVAVPVAKEILRAWLTKAVSSDTL